jgi:hypothetical protein
MTATRKPLLTRRRVIAAAVLLVLVLVMAGLVFGMFDSDSVGRVRATVVGFEEQPNQKSTVAVVTLSNGSHRTVVLGIAFDWNVCAGFRSPAPTSAVGWLPPLYVLRSLSLCSFPPGAVWTNRAALPQDGRSGWLAISYSEQPHRLPAFLKPLDVIGCKLRPPRTTNFDAICDQEIQCPLVLPDGTVQPPRLMPKGERKTP